MVDTVVTRKFSEFVNGGDLKNNETTVGLLSGANAQYNNPWTFLASGATGDRPIPAPDIYYRLRLNTTLRVYEYYDPISAMWVELSGSGTGTINPGVTNDIPFYPANGTTLSPLTAAANSVLVTSAGMVPSLSTTLPSGLSIPGATITSSTAALTSGSVVAAPVAGNDIVNKTYADGLHAGTVHSITGTTNQVIASSPTGDVTLSLPQDIATGSSPTFSALHLSSSTPHAVLIGQGASPINSVLLGAGQVLIGTTSGDPAASAINSGQNILVGNASGSITVSFNGVLPVANGGTGLSSFAQYDMIYASAANTLAALSKTNSASLVSSSSGQPLWSSTMTNGQVIIGSTGATPTASTLTAGSGISITNGAGLITISASTSGMTWTTISGTSQNAVVNNGYIANNAATVTFTLPATAAIGDEVAIEGLGAGGWTLTANTGQTIKIGSTTTSSAGSLSSVNASDNVYVTCIVANTTWRVRTTNSVGLTIS